jgi:carbamoyl-phosphate synthase large subunit
MMAGTHPQRPTVLVLGVGGNVSQGILKALRLGGLDCRVVGACTSAAAMGLYTCDKAFLSPPAADQGFLDWLVGCCRTESVRGILSGVEPVLAVLSRHRDTLLRETGAVAVVSSAEVLGVCGDKLRTSRWLREHGLAAPRSADAGDLAAAAALGREAGYPLIAKPRGGKGSGGVFLVAGEGDLESVRDLGGYLVQEHVGDPGEEYTAATFSDGDGAVRGCIVIRRELQAGTTYRARVEEFPEVRRETLRIAAALRPLGPCNMQFRMRGRQPVCFEINARFSGTSPMRARFGFNDVEAAVRHLVLGEAPRDLPWIRQGVALRYWNELYLDAGAAESLERQGFLDSPASWGRIEDYGLAR